MLIKKDIQEDNKWKPKNTSFELYFIELQCTYHSIHHFKVYNSVIFSILQECATIASI